MKGIGSLEGALQILGFVDNDTHKHGTIFYDKNVFSPNQISNIFLFNI